MPTLGSAAKCAIERWRNHPNPSEEGGVASCISPAISVGWKLISLVWNEIAQYLTIANADARTVRERALLTLGYDAMKGREELVALDCEDLTWCAETAAPDCSSAAPRPIRKARGVLCIW